MKNGNKKLSRNSKRRNEREIKMAKTMKSLLNQSKNQKKRKNKDIVEIKNLEIELVNIKYSNKPDKLESALKELNKIEVINKNLHQIKYEILLDYTGEFEMVGRFKIVDHIRDILFRFRNINDYEGYVNKIDQDYESDNAFLMVLFIN